MTTDSWVMVALEWAGKGGLLFAAALCAMPLMRRASAAARHFVLGVALVGAAALVPLVALLPGWRLPLIAGIGASAGQVAPHSRDGTVDAIGEEIVESVHARPSNRRVPPGVYRMPPFAASGATIANGRNGSPAAAVTLDTAVSFVRAIPPVAAIAYLWAFGAFVVTGMHGVSILLTGWLRRRARPIADRQFIALRDELAESLGIRRAVSLYASDSEDMPATWGATRAAILLPRDAANWTTARRRAVLYHELAHVARRDCAWQLVATVACAIHWFNPAAWVVARRLRLERERACDDLVLASGIDACDYADHLVSVARQFRARPATAMAAIAMARPSQLEGRLVAILDSALPRRAPSRAWRVRAAVLSALLVLPTAAMRPWKMPPSEVRETSSPALTGTAAAPNTTHASPALTGLPELTAPTDTLRWTRRMRNGQTLRVYTMKSAVLVERSPDDDVHLVTIFGAADGRGPRQHEFDEDDRSIEVCPALPAGVKRIPRSGCWPVDWEGEMARDNTVRTIVRVPEGIRLDIKTGSGDIVSTDARNSISAGSVDGSIRLRSSAYASANTVTGDVDVILTRTDWRGDLPLKTVSGHLNVTLPAAADADVELMNSNGDNAATFAMDRVWRGAQWRFHGAARLGRGGRKITAETWTGRITIRQDGSTELIPVKPGYTFESDDPDPNPNPNPGGDSPSPSPSPSPSVRSSDRARANVFPAVSIRGTSVPGAFPYDALPPEYEALIDKPYVSEIGGLTGERVGFNLRAGFLRKFSRAALRGATDSAAVAKLAQFATAQWIAYHLGAPDPGVELVGERAIWALWRRGEGALVPEMMRQLASDDWRARAYAAWTLGEVSASSANEALIEALGDEHWRVRMSAAYALTNTHPAAARTALERALSDDDHQVRAGALDALAAIGDPRSVPAVRALLNDSHAIVRDQAATALAVLRAK